MKRYERPEIIDENLELEDVIAASYASTTTVNDENNGDPISSIFNL